MKIKELQKTVCVAWSPQQQCPILLAAGTAAQQIVETSSASTLELYSLNLSDPGYDLELTCTQQSAHKFHKLVWSPFDMTSQTPNGVIVGGCESGYLKIYSVSKLMAGEDALIAQTDKHNGAVRTLDYNPFKSNLLASAASESEIFIWDLNNTTTPMTPGAKTQPFEDVCGVAWNRQVQHILASVFPSRCVIWDLRKNEPIIKLSDTQSRVRWRVVQWHPDVATQLWLASEDDQAPVIQLWDLRYATAPSKTLQIHSRGVLGMTWCPKDPELMISCAKDNKILCWNATSDEPNGELMSEIAATNQWYSDISWCPRNPALIAASNIDGNVSIYSLFGGSQHQVQTSSKIADSFPGMEQLTQEPMPHQLPNANTTIFHDLKKPPKWLKRPCGLSFGFGGKLVTYNGNSRSINVNQMITDEALVKRSSELEDVLVQGNFAEYCCQKADASPDQHNRFVWYFLKAYFESNTNDEFLNLLGYQVDDVANKFSKFIDSKDQLKSDANNVDGLVDRMATLSQSDSTDVDPCTSTEDSMDLSNNDAFDLIGKLNGPAAAVLTNGDSTGANVPFKLSTADDTEGLICEALLTGNIPAAVELCMNAGRSTDAIILAMTGGSELLARTQYRYLKNNDSYISNLISALVTEDWSGVISQCTIDSWKEALVAALTHSKEQTPLLCERLGERLQIESGGDPEIVKNSILCYICAGSIERIVDAWNSINTSNEKEASESEKLQELVEVVILLNRAMEFKGKRVHVFGKYADLLSKYASLLAAQGSLDMALTYIGTSADDPNIIELRERLYYALGHKQQQQVAAPKANNQFGNPYQTGNQRFGQQRNSIPNAAMPPVNTFQPSFNTGLPGSVGMSMNNQFDAPPNVAQTQWNAPAPAPVTKPPQMMNPTDLQQPPRPPSVGGSQQTSGSRSKYLLDPSVQSGPSYGQQAPNTMFGNNQGSYNNSMSQGQQFGAPITTQPMNPLMPMQPQTFEPQQQQMNFNQQPFGFQNNMQSQPPASLAPPPNVQQLQKNPTPPPGWNDPPEMSSRKSQYSSQDLNSMSAEHAGTKKWRQKHSHDSNHDPSNDTTQPKKDIQAAAPIMHPLFGGAEPQQMQMPGQNQYPGQNDQMFQQQQQQQQYGGQGGFMPPTQAPAMMTPGPPPTSQSTPVGFYQQQNPQSQPQQPMVNNSVSYQNFQNLAPQPQQTMPPPVQEPPKPKAPLPEEYIYMQTVLEELKTQCIATAGNPQTKRKLEDVSKRLESLYDLLRENRLSQNTLQSLNQLVQLIQIGDYGNGLGLHTQMVSGPDFSKIASFMPGIKILLQLAMQLQVYLR